MSGLEWAEASIDVASVPEDGARWDLEADAPARAAVAERLQVDAVEALRATFDIKPMAGGGLRAKGTIEATLKRICVVTDEPFAEKVGETFMFRILDDAAALADNPHPDDPDMEVAEDGRVDLSDVAIQQLSVAMAAYPRGPEADRQMAEIGREMGQPAGQGEASNNPFSALAAQLGSISSNKDEK